MFCSGFMKMYSFYGIRNPSKGDISSIRASAPIMAALIMVWLRVPSPVFMAMPVAPAQAIL